MLAKIKNEPDSLGLMLLYGTESYMIDGAVSMLKRAFLGEGAEDMDLAVIDTRTGDKFDMGKLEEQEGGSMLAYAAEKRMGTPEELGFAIATVADERNGYLAGVDVLVDGGSTNGKNFRK